MPHSKKLKIPLQHLLKRGPFEGQLVGPVGEAILSAQAQTVAIKHLPRTDPQPKYNCIDLRDLIDK